MPLPDNKLQDIMDFDYAALGPLVTGTIGVDVNVGLVTLTRKPEAYENVPPANMPWLLQTDGDGIADFRPSSQVSEQTDLVYLGYVARNEAKYPGLSTMEIRRGLMADIEKILDVAEDRGGLVFNRDRTREVFDDPYGKWSMFVITETVHYHRSIV